MTLNLFYVRAEDANCEDLGLLVRAGTADEVLPLWRAHFALEDSEVPTWIGLVPGVTADGELGVIDWESIAHPGTGGVVMPTWRVLYFIRADIDNENQDSLVIAVAPEEAEAFWRNAFGIADDEAFESIGIVPGVVPTKDVGIVDWGVINPTSAVKG